MFYAFVALICAVVGIIPLALSRKPIASAVQGVVSFFALWWFLYLGVNSTVWPLFRDLCAHALGHRGDSHFGLR